MGSENPSEGEALIVAKVYLEGDRCSVEDASGITHHTVDKDTTIHRLFRAHKNKARKLQEAIWPRYFRHIESLISDN